MKIDNIFWITTLIAPITEIRVSTWEHPRRQHNLSVSGKHIGISPDCAQHLFKDYFSSEEDYLNIAKPGIGYIYVERRHWLRNMLWRLQHKLCNIFIDWLPRLMEYIVVEKMNKGKFVLEDSPLEKSWQYRF